MEKVKIYVDGIEYEVEKNKPLNHTLLFFLSLNALTSCILPKLIHTS